jgi:hypothetical protein
MTLAASPPPRDPSACACAAARLANGWCAACGVGHVASVEIRSAILFEALDAHGHEIDAASLRCESCRAAERDDGFCSACRCGFVGGQLYFTRLTWLLARGEQRGPETIECRTCRRNARHAPRPGAEDGRAEPPERKGGSEGDAARNSAPEPRDAPPGDAPRAQKDPPGWCASCGVGMVGSVAFRDRAEFEQALRERARLLRAVAESRRCETCAVALFFDGRCASCAIRYRDGRKIEAPPRLGPPPGDP